MDHLNLVDTNRRYKAGTTKIITWLVSNVQRLRKSGKNNTNSNATSNKVTVSDLLTYAERIVRSTNPRIQIHEDILDILHDVISGRTAAHGFYSCIKTEQQSGALQSSNASHLHFIQALKDVQNVLRTTYKARLPARKRDDFAVDAPKQGGDMSNVFAALDIQGKDAAGGEAAAEASRDEKLERVGIKQKKGKSKSKDVKALTKPEEQEYELEGIDTIDEPLAIWCLLKDLQDIRGHVRSLWQRFKDGKLSFLTVSRLTENATDITIHRCRELSTMMPKLQLWTGLVNAVGLEAFAGAFVEACGSAPIPPEGDTARLMSIEQGRNAGLLCFHGWATMTHFCDELHKTLVEEHTPVTGVQLSKTTDLIKVLDTTMPFLRQLLDDSSDKDLTDKVVGLDNFTIMLLGVLANGRLSLEVVACAEIHIDIHDVIDSKTEVGYNDSLTLLEALQAQLTSFRQALSSGSKTVKEHLPDHFGKTAAVVHDSLQQVWQDHSPSWCSSSSRLEGGNTLVVPLNVLQGLPIVPAAMTRRLLISKATFDPKPCSYSHVILTTAYLYRGAQASGILKTSWSDMDFFIDRQNTKSRFCRPAMNSVKSAWKAYTIAQGVKASNLSSNSRAMQKGRRIQASNDVIEVQPISAYLESLLEAGKVYHTVGKKATSSLRVLYGIVKVHAETGPGIRDPVIAAQYKGTRALTPVQLLGVIQEAAIDDEIQFMFDHLGFVVHCTRILEAVAEACASDLSSVPGILGNDMHSLVQVVNDILFQAASAEDEGKSLKHSMLEAACGILEKDIGAASSQFLDKARGLCGGQREELQQDN
ncbi:hypothetical protein LTR86_010625 [Recurvomyces mirabilis]|nr:hypothetical protein LTR86_010625 [Recurvomyces mirabilis]